MNNQLARLHATLAAVCPILGVSGVQGSASIAFDPTATQPQRDAASSQLASFDWSQATHDAWNTLQVRNLSKLLISADDPASKEIKAFVLVTLDAFNRQSRQFRDLLAAIAAATSLVNLQARAAAITPVEPAHVVADLKVAMTAKIDAGLTDG